jgi:hypothetical protein
MPSESELVLACWQPHYDAVTKERVADYFACRCCPESNRCVRKKANGYTNLKTHLIDKHKDYWMDSARKILAGEVRGPIDLIFGATDKAKQIHGWMTQVVMNNLPLSFVDNPINRRYSKLKSLSSKSLKKYMRRLKKFVMRQIEYLLKKSGTFGLIQDGWSEGVEHYLSIFATFTEEIEDKQSKEIKYQVRELLLAFSVIEDIDDATVFEDGSADDKIFGLTAEDLFDLIIGVLAHDFNIEVHGEPVNVDTIHQIVEFFSQDNCSANRRLCNLCEIPMKGCGSHRFALGVDDFLGSEEKKNKQGRITQEASYARKLIKKIDLLMGELKTIKNAALLRQHTHLLPERNNVTRWSSVFLMLKKWLLIHGAVGTVRNFPLSVTSKIPTAVEHQDIIALVEHLKKFQGITLELQLGGTERCTLEEERRMFDDIIQRIENLPGDDPFAGAVLSHLKSDSAIVNNPDFENGIIKIQSGKEAELTDAEVTAIQIFKKPDILSRNQVVGSPEPAAYASSIRDSLRAEKRQRTEASQYRKTFHVSTTSNVCERLNSNARLIMNYLRKHMDPDTLQLILFLKHNRDFWKAEKVIDDILGDQTLVDDESDNEEDDDDECDDE